MSNYQKITNGVPRGATVQGTDLGSGSATSSQFLAANGSSGAAFRSLALTDLPTITVPYGGTGQISFTANGILLGNGTSALSQVSVGGSGTVLQGNGGAPSFTTTPTLGQNTVSTGVIYLANGNASGASVGIANQSATTSYVFYLPATAGTNNQVLTSAGANNTPTWTTPAATPTLTSLGIFSGKTTIGSGATSVAVTFSTAYASTAYSVTCNFLNTTDTNPTFQLIDITTQSTTGFTAKWNGALPTANYSLSWQAIASN